MYSSHPAKEKCTRTQREAHSLQFEKIYRHVQLAHSKGKMYSHTARSTHLTICKNIPACTARTQRRKNVLAHSEKQTAYNLKKYTGMYSSHTAKKKFTRTCSERHTAHNLKKYTGMYSSHPAAKEKCTRTQRGAHSSQFEKIYRHVQFTPSEGKMYSHTARSTQLTI